MPKSSVPALEFSASGKPWYRQAKTWGIAEHAFGALCVLGAIIYQGVPMLHRWEASYQAPIDDLRDDLNRWPANRCQERLNLLSTSFDQAPKPANFKLNNFIRNELDQEIARQKSVQCLSPATIPHLPDPYADPQPQNQAVGN